MSEFKELVKSFSKTREYVRDFFVYGFKTREDFTIKSSRTYDNERRRLESWLSGFVRQDYTAKGKNISLAIDSNLLDSNPLYKVWKTKSFTDNDISLHFHLLDFLSSQEKCTVEELSNGLLEQYGMLFDTQTIRRKCKEYEHLGLLTSKKQGKSLYYRLAPDDVSLLHRYPELLSSFCFFQLVSPLGFLGSTLMDVFSLKNQLFRVKHSFFVHTLEDEMLFLLLQAMEQQVYAKLEIQSSKNRRDSTVTLLPLKFFTSTRTGRRFLCGYLKKPKRFSCFRMDTIKNVTFLSKAEDYQKHFEDLEQNLQNAWGVSFQNTHQSRMEWISFTLEVVEPYEHYIVNRLEREGKGGVISQLDDMTYQYEKQVFDANEMLPWIRTFIGRIKEFHCSSPFVEQRFYHDLQVMYQMYQEE
ncbi:MAG: helix-turn-helix domain-containing protein [Lachnospiraceae bacterium]|nr:helix-turn-helix domain-containing protein [Lachnospiraceae bacterium]